MGIKFIIVCFIVLVFFFIYDLIDTLKLREEQNAIMDKEIRRLLIQNTKLYNELEGYKKYRRDTDEIRNADD